MSEKNDIQRYRPVAPALERWRPTAAPSYERWETEGGPDLQAYWRVIRNRRWTILGIVLVVFIGVFIGTLLMKPIYRATGLLEIGRENPDLVPVEALFKLETMSDVYLQTQFEILKSATVAQRVINQLHLDKVEEFNPPAPWWSLSRWFPSPPRKPEQILQSMLGRFQDQLLIEPVKGSRLVKVNFDSEDPQRGAQIVNALFSNYADMRLEAGQKTTKVLSKQLEGTRTNLEKSESELLKYAREKGLLFLESNKGDSENIVNERLRQVQAELTKAEAARYEKESLYQLAQKGDYESLPSLGDNKVLQDLTVRLADLKREHAQLAATFTADYPKVKQVKSQVDELEAMLARERQRAAERITNDYRAAGRRESLLRQAFQAQQGVANVTAERSSQYGMLKRDVETNEQLYGVLQQKLKEADVAAGLKASNVSIVDLAQPPRTPDRPKLTLNLALALVVGLGLGVGVASLREYFDTTLKTSEEVNRFLDVPALGMIPCVESLYGRQLHGAGSLDSSQAPSLQVSKPTFVAGVHWFRIDTDGRQYSALAEAFGCLRTSVMLSAGGAPPRSVLISSSQPGEGKTTVSVNLAISLAQLGQRVLLIDADTRRPAVHKALGIKNRTGLVNYLESEKDWSAVVQPTRVTRLEVLTTGRPTASPTELLSSWRMRELVGQALGNYDFVVVDSPALLINAADARILAALVDGVVLVVRSGATPRDIVQRARSQVPNVIGVVLNKLDVGLFADYYRGYYGADGKSAGASEEREAGRLRV